MSESPGTWSEGQRRDAHLEAVEARDRVLADLATAVDDLAALDFDALADDGVRELLRATQRQLDRLAAMRTKAAGMLQGRLVRQAGTGKENQAIRDTREFLTNELRLTPSEAKKTERTGSRLAQNPRTSKAFEAGELGSDHAQVITETLQRLYGDTRDRVEAELVEAAGNQNPVELGRIARRLLAEADYEREVANEQRRHEQRSVRIAQRPDGYVGLHAQLSGIAAERAIAALKAYEQPDTRGEPARTPEQRAADALDQIFDVALRAGEAPTQHGVRPQVAIVIRWGDLAKRAGIAELEFTGPVTLAEVRPLLADAAVTRVVLDAVSLPMDVSERVRTVPAALWTALKLRDGGCAWHGCSAPPGWCDVAHGDDPFRSDGRLSLANAVLLCRRHHRMFDRGGWRLRIDGPDVSFERVDQSGNANAPP